MRKRVIGAILSIVGGALGGAAGYYAFFWILTQGFYALVLPGALLGAGCGLLSRGRSWVRGICCGAAAFLLGVYTEWRHEWFAEPNDGFLYELTHVHELGSIKLILIAAGTVLACWMGRDSLGGVGRRDEPGRAPGPPPSPRAEESPR